MRTTLERLRAVVREALDAGESQAALGKRLGVAQGTISGWLTEERLDPRASVLEAVAQKLDVNGHWLLTGQGRRRALDTGTEAVYAEGVQEGLRRAENAIRALRATSTLSEAERKGLEVIALRDKLAGDQPSPQRRAGGAGRRKAGGR